ncbi:hypothetical protein TIFTF001_037881 [Ficus carica]|uniref:Uncharacterized protein n=1 Tax=Ficus carica TaxID=3494 RepID=A0AA88E9J2_FICCA|nr:hypothetical protein TIFTF001_037866 [Ficus carica]GMN68830.1 hypothetical protein TIFTF001_037881 [Ficus carica]
MEEVVVTCSNMVDDFHALAVMANCSGMESHVHPIALEVVVIYRCKEVVVICRCNELRWGWRWRWWRWRFVDVCRRRRSITDDSYALVAAVTYRDMVGSGLHALVVVGKHKCKAYNDRQPH